MIHSRKRMIQMNSRTKLDFERAAALFWALGGEIPHDPGLERTASEKVKEWNSREKTLRRAAELCGEGDTPQQKYLLTKLYSWMGAEYAEKTIRFASSYLSGEPWSKLPRATVRQDGISVNQEIAARASIFSDLALAQMQRGESSPALANYSEAYRLEPYNAMYPVKIADLLALTRGVEEALEYLRNQKSSAYYRPVRYTDERGVRRENDTFRQLLDAHIRKMEARKAALEQSIR